MLGFSVWHFLRGKEKKYVEKLSMYTICDGHIQWCFIGAILCIDFRFVFNKQFCNVFVAWNRNEWIDNLLIFNTERLLPFCADRWSDVRPEKFSALTSAPFSINNFAICAFPNSNEWINFELKGKQNCVYEILIIFAYFYYNMSLEKSGREGEL